MAEKRKGGDAVKPAAKPAAKRTVKAAKPKTPKAQAVAKGSVEIPLDAQGKPDLLSVRTQIDGIDREIQSLIAERALWAHQVGKA